mgnify:CR=1 FL=1
MTKAQIRERLLKLCDSRLPLESCKPFSDKDLVPDLINFIASFPSFSSKLFDIHGNVTFLGSRLGRGEVLLYFIYDNLTLGGSTSSIDCFVDEKPSFEIKCAKKDGDGYSDVLLGIDEVESSLTYFYKILKLFDKARQSGKLPIPSNFVNISKTKLQALSEIYPVTKKLEEEYFVDLLNSPIGNKKFLIFDKQTRLPVFYGYLKRKNLKIDRVSGGLVRLSFIFENHD